MQDGLGLLQVSVHICFPCSSILLWSCEILQYINLCVLRHMVLCIKFRYIFVSVVLFCLAAVIFPMGFHVDAIGGQPYQLPNSHQVGISYILFVLALWITVISELFAGKVCLPQF